MHVMQVAGAEVLVTQVIKKLARQIEPTVFCLDAIGELGERLQAEGVPVVCLDRKPGLDLAVAKRLAAEVADRKIQVLHAHQYTPFFYTALARLRYRSKARVLFTEHGRHYPDIVSPKRRWINRLVLQRYADITTACCDFSTEALQHVEGFPRAVTLVNGVDIDTLPGRGNAEQQHALRERLGLDLDRPYAACIARFHSVKDHRTLLRAWQHVQQALPAARLLLVGDGPERKACEQFAEELGVASSVEFWGIRKDVGDILRAIDVFTLTSVSEAASLTLLEAMASECPAVLTAVGGNAEHVTEGKHGYLAPRGDDQQIAKRLEQLLTDSATAKKMGKAARQRVLQDFELDDVIAEYANLYSQLASKAK
ncbi:Putative glycosyltransferase EpsD [Roseimaritima multifibrata]|uniref:Glycosyltransferase EpsD n=2 Tax=Roseimaritima multifibrata TaxID=1930274 RepID=A0A517MNK4_9BACT|nr:Putative glycosyltransferase EpsD [Roseimaritima multifibrata]